MGEPRPDGEWTPIFILPNVDFRLAIESRNALLTGLTDERISKVAAAQPTFSKFIKSFTDAFGRTVIPSVLLLRSNAPKEFFRIDALAGFRDLVGMAVIPYNRALWLQYRTLPKTTYSNSFSLYPWTLSRDFAHLVLNTSAMLAMDDVKTFRGQSSPELSPQQISFGDLDQPLLQKLLDIWEKTYRSRRPEWSQKALFRALNMANQASQIPTSAEVSLYDAGRNIALWVSAFEILVHPGEGGWSGPKQVLDLLERVKWEISSLSHRRYRVRLGRDAPTRRIFASSLYSKLNWLRNQFLHGNAISPAALALPRNAGHPGDYAPLLFRMALTAFLNINWTVPIPATSDPKNFGQWISDRHDFTHAQRAIEEGLRIAITGWRNEKRRR